MQLVTRSQWGARYDDGSGPAPIPSEWWLHHSAGLMPDLRWIDVDGDGVDDDEERVVRALEETGQQRFGQGMSYTFLVAPSGRGYTGHTMARRGAHTKNRNDKARAICLIGDYSVHRPTNAQMDTVAEIMVEEWRAGRARTYLLNGGHRDVGATECPGDHAYALIFEINRRAAALAVGAPPHTPKGPRMLLLDLPETSDLVDLVLDPRGWPLSRELTRALLPPAPGNWRGLGSISSLVCGWAVDSTGKAQDAGQPSGYIDYLRVFHHSSGGPQGYRDLLVTDLLIDAELVGNWSVPALMLPAWSTAFAIRYAAPAGLSMAVEYEH